jgi:hypothetical protein
MIAVSLTDGEGLVDLFLRKEADVNAKSECKTSTGICCQYLHNISFQRPGENLYSFQLCQD